MSSPSSITRPRKCIVVGAGPVGCLAAIALANQGWNVDVYEGRPDIRLPSSKAYVQQRSINLAISSRGITALQAIYPAAADRFLASAIPMSGRMIHRLDGTLDSQLYDKDGQCINSIDRALLNEELLDEASRFPSINLYFKHKVQSLDFDQRTLVARDVDAGQDRHVDFDLCIGADGSYSVVRRQMMRVVRMDYLQEYISHEYLELKMPAGRNQAGELVHLIDPDHLHIWPRHSFMLIALPNKDFTFTCTLFAPSDEFDSLDSETSFKDWFRHHFPDAMALIGEEGLMHDFTHNPRSPLMCTKSKPYHYKDRAILLGDAAHAMVPFYGQGLNCGLEDVRILNAVLQKEQVEPTVNVGQSDDVDPRLSRALHFYSENRHEDLVAICELASDNYLEMRHAVTTPLFRLRKTLDNLLYSLTSIVTQAHTKRKVSPLDIFLTTEPNGWLPLYTMITFRPDISYATARRKARRQTEMVDSLGRSGLVLTGLVGLWASWRFMRGR